MREQITTGIYNAIQQAAATTGSCADTNPLANLSRLTDAEAGVLVEQVLAALAETPHEAPTLTTTPATPQPVFSIDPAMLVAREARIALDRAEADLEVSSPGGEVPYVYMDASESAEHSPSWSKSRREFLFKVQEMFGCKVRCVRSGTGMRRFVVVGTANQREALLSIMESFDSYATDVLADMSVEQQCEFWATLGHLVASTDEAEVLIENNRPHYARARQIMREGYGPAQELPRTAPATEGTGYDLAVSMVGQHTI